jgi:hypothetical protein
MTKRQGKNTPRKTATKALRALRKHSIEEGKSAIQIAQSTGISYSAVWLWLSRDSANYNLTHESEDMINLYLEEYDKDKTPPVQLDLPVRLKPNTETVTKTIVYPPFDPEEVRLKPDTEEETTGLAYPPHEDQDKMLVLPKEDVMKIVGYGLNRFMRREITSEKYTVVGLEFEGNSGRILFRSREDG